MKKTLAMLMAAALTISLTACGATQSDADQTASAADPSSATVQTTPPEVTDGERPELPDGELPQFPTVSGPNSTAPWTGLRRVHSRPLRGRRRKTTPSKPSRKQRNTRTVQRTARVAVHLLYIRKVTWA